MVPDNYYIADQFSLLSKLMDIHGENAFKAKTYSVAAFNIEKLPTQLADLPEDKIFTLKGIGESVGAKILEILREGHLSGLEEYVRKTPPGVIEMLSIKGLGPKKISIIWKQMEIESVGELLHACQENRLARFKGFGLKTQENVEQAITFVLKSQGSHLYAEVESYAWSVDMMIRTHFPARRFELTGQFRRQSEVIDSLEWVTTATVKEVESFFSVKGFQTIELLASTAVFKGTENLLLKFYCHKEEHYFRKIFETSCSDQFLDSWNERFTWLPDGNYKSEEKIFSSVGLRYIPACLREKPWVLDEAKTRGFENLIQPGDLRGIIHSHSTWSDGVDTILDMAEACMARGMEYLVISDHSKNAFYAKGLLEDQIRAQHEQIDELNEKVKPFRIFKSIECDILSDGSLDYNDNILPTFDLVIVSVHSNLKMTQEKAMPRLLKAISNPYTTILGHMTGRLLLSRRGFPVDHKVIIDACKANNVVIEINANPRRLDMAWEHIDYAMKAGVMLSIDPDAHSIGEFNLCKYGVLTAQKGGLTPDKNLSSFSLKQFEAFLKKRKHSRTSLQF